MCLSPVCHLSWTCLFVSFAYFLIGLFVFYCWLLSLRVLYIFQILVLCQIHTLQTSSPSFSLSFILLTGSFAEQIFYIFMKLNLSVFFLLWILLIVLRLRTICPPPDPKDLFLCVFFPESFIFFFTFKSVMHLEFCIISKIFWFLVFFALHEWLSSPALFGEKPFFLYWVAFALKIKSVKCVFVGLFVGSVFCSIDLSVSPSASTM